MSRFWEDLSTVHNRLLRDLPREAALREIRKNYISPTGNDNEHTKHEVESLREYLPEIKSVLEIGAGEGRTAKALLKEKPSLKYEIIDILPAVQIAKQNLGDKVDFFLPPWIERRPKKFHDLTICISVLSELDAHEVLEYIKLAWKSKYFYLKDWTHWNDARHTVVDYKYYRIPETWDVVFYRPYPLYKGFFEALYRIP